MAYSGLTDFINDLQKKGELHIIKTFVDPVLEITEVTNRITKTGGKALLFENTGTRFRVLINAFGSDKRMATALGEEDINEAGKEIESLFNSITDVPPSFIKKISSLPALLKIAGFMPAQINKKGTCQQIIHRDSDLALLPVLKCWPHDGGRFITLPMVHTIHPESGKTNVGMYRMQILDNKTTAMHWQRHKTGANHFEAWKRLNRKMPVSVALGGDPVYAYSATAPLPENISEYILAGFLRKKKVKLVRCITNDIYVPSDADIIIEGYVDPEEEPVWEGPFGDHTGFYSLADWYPRFHVTCITHRKDAIYPAIIVGIPPQEDSWLTRATEKIFLPPFRMVIQPEIEDFHLPEPGVAHNLAIVRINKTYPGQGMKVINSLFGAGQMMFTKYLVIISGDVNIRNYRDLAEHIFANTNFTTDILFCKGPLDVLDHSSDTCSFGGKAGIDATVKLPEEIQRRTDNPVSWNSDNFEDLNKRVDGNIIKSFDNKLIKYGIPILILSVNPSEDSGAIDKVKDLLREGNQGKLFRLILAVDHTVDVNDYFTVAWQILGNSDPQRDHSFISPSLMMIDGTIKIFHKDGFPRKWPNVVCSDAATIRKIDEKWESLGFDTYIQSPSLKHIRLLRNGEASIDY
ncbi:MAG TPA: menaquinone biosynthesis decarboxylase [Bacteroidales bacterium]|nr:menaquinone biosynthesis decarboxylase [Bacteroidales bacterium]